MIKVILFAYDSIDDLYANTYVLIDDDNNCVVIDPSKPNQSIINYIEKNNLNLKAVLLTHGHIDHMRGADVIVEHFNTPLFIGFNDYSLLKDPRLNCSTFFFKEEIVQSKAETLADGQILRLLNEDCLVIETPYHTAGSVCYYFRKSGILFSGDFILEHTIGRSDLPTAVPKKLHESMSKIVSLPDETIVYSGHGRKSTLKEERCLNTFVK